MLTQPLLQHKLARYVLAGVGPIFVAGSQFLLTLSVMWHSEPRHFGAFSFLFTCSVLSWGIWSALFCAPFQVLINRGSDEDGAFYSRLLITGNFFGAMLAMSIFIFLGLVVGLAATEAVLFSVYGALALIRWFARSYSLSLGSQINTTLSDVAYGCTLLVGVGVMQLNHTSALTICYVSLIASSAIGLLPFGKAYLMQQFVQLSPRVLRDYGPVWRNHARWSLVGIFTTEASANAHVYLVTALQGPNAFAPIAASAVMMRPITIAMNALSDFERPQLARQIGRGEYGGIAHSLRFFRLGLTAIWISTIILVLGLVYFAPDVIFPARYDFHELAIATSLWMVVGGIRLIQSPESALLQAAGRFRELAQATIGSSIVSVSTVLLFLITAGEVWSIIGIILGQSVNGYLTWKKSMAWRREHPAA